MAILRLLQTLFVITVLSLSFNSFAKHTYTYYRQLTISPKYKFIGNYEVAERFTKKVNCYEFRYNKYGELDRITYLKNGKPAMDKYLSISKIKLTYNKDGAVHRRYYNKKNKPITDKINGVYGTSVIYDTLRGIISMKCHDIGKEEYMKDQYGVTNYVLTLDKDGDIQSLAYCDARGKPLDTEIYRIKYDHEKDKNAVNQYFSDRLGNILSGSDNIVKVKKIYDDLGNLTEERYLDKSGNLVESAYSGIALTRWKFDRNGNLLEEIVYGADEMPKEDSIIGVSKTKWRYDGKGNVMEEKYYNINNKLTNKKNHELFKHAIIKWRYDKKGRIETIQYFDEKRKLVSVIEHPNDEITLR